MSRPRNPLAEVQAAKAQLAALETRLLSHAGRLEVAADGSATSTANWYAITTLTTRPQAHRLIRIAAALDTHDQTRTALAADTVHLDQAEVILRTLGELPDDLDPETIAHAERHLLDLAGDRDATALRVLGRRILHVVSPEAADAHEATLLDRAERAAAAATRLTMWDDGQGRVHGRFTLDTLTGAALKKVLFAGHVRRLPAHVSPTQIHPVSQPGSR